MIELTEGMINKSFKVTCKDNSIFTGKCISYIPSKDNDPEIDSIWFENNKGEMKEIYQPDIKSLEKIER